MIKVIASGDHHFDEHDSRWGECLKVHDWMVELVEREEPDLFVSGGDIYDRASTPAGREAVASWVTRIAEVCPVLIAKGNHDRPLDLAILRRLLTRHPVVVEEAAGVHVLGGVAVAAMAWPNKASLMAMLGREVDLQSADDAARAAIQDVMRGLGQQLDQHEGLPRLAVGHWMIDGSRTSTGQPLWGQELRVGLEDLALMRTPLVIAGHVHAPQSFPFGPMEALYTGSPFRTAYGETELKSVVIATYEGTEVVDVERRKTPAQQMILMEAEFGDGIWSGEVVPRVDDHVVDGADIRFRYQVAPAEREAAKASVAEVRNQLLGLGAAVVKVEEIVRQSTTARSTEVAEAKTTADKLRCLWRLRGEEMEPKREARVLGRLAELEEQVA